MPKVQFRSATAALAIASSWFFSAMPASAEDCLLDRDNDGAVDATTDNDGGGEFCQF